MVTIVISNLTVFTWTVSHGFLSLSQLPAAFSAASVYSTLCNLGDSSEFSISVVRWSINIQCVCTFEPSCRTVRAELLPEHRVLLLQLLQGLGQTMNRGAQRLLLPLGASTLCSTTATRYHFRHRGNKVGLHVVRRHYTLQQNIVDGQTAQQKHTSSLQLPEGSWVSGSRTWDRKTLLCFFLLTFWKTWTC